MTRKNKIISIAVLAVLAFTVLCTSGVTLALNLTSTRQSGTLHTADLKLSANVNNLVAYAAVPASESDVGAFSDGHGNFYKHVQCVKNDDGAYIFDDRKGGVQLSEDEDGQNVTIENIMPGDKVEFDIAVVSESNIAFDYRAELYVNSSDGPNLINQLDFSAEGRGVWRKKVSGDGVEGDDKLTPAVITDYTAWNKIGSSVTEVETIHVSVELPVSATKGQGEKVKLHYVVRGSQNEEVQKPVASVTTRDNQTVSFTTLAEAVEYAQDNGIRDISVIGGTLLEEGEVRINRALNFTGVADGQGNYPVLNGVRIVMENGAGATFANVNFGGNSYIDVTNAMALTLNDCLVDVKGVEYYDSVSRDFLEDSAFIVSGKSLTPVTLNVTNSVIRSSNGGAAISLRSPLGDGTLISKNTFGSSEFVYDGTAVMIFNGAYKMGIVSESDRPVVTVSDNAVYGSKALSLGSGASAMSYLVYSSNNSAYGIQNEFVTGAAYGSATLAAFVDSNSTIDGNAVTIADVGYESLILGGVNVTLNNNLIAKGNVALGCVTEDEFYTLYTVGGASDDIVLYNGNN